MNFDHFRNGDGSSHRTGEREKKNREGFDVCERGPDGKKGIKIKWQKVN